MPNDSAPRRLAAKRSKNRPSAERSAPRASAVLDGLPVLVVDDDPANAKLVAVILAPEGCHVRVAGSAEAALALLATGFRPRVIVLDLVLPLMSGVLLAERLKADPETRDIVLIAVTAFNGHTVERVAREAGCVEYVRKPIDPLTFTQIVVEHLGGKS